MEQAFKKIQEIMATCSTGKDLPSPSLEWSQKEQWN